MFDDFTEILDDDVFEEKPVDLKTFVEDEHFMGMPPLSSTQQHMLEAMTQIYRPETIAEAYDNPKYVQYLQKLRVKEIIAAVGKSSGKNHTTILAVCRIAYLLMCLKDPAKYYGYPTETAIDMLNVAVNSPQAYRTFFKPLTNQVRRSPWFEGRYDDAKRDELKFDKNITAYSGHSKREAWEGFNFIFVVLDEIAAYKVSAETNNKNARADTAPEIYASYKAAVTSRYPDVGKLCLLSFPRFDGDYITQRYDEAVLEHDRTYYSEECKIDTEGPETEANRIKIEWYEDEPVTYAEPNVLAIKKPTFRMNPLRSLSDYAASYAQRQQDTLTRFFVNPPKAESAFFTDADAVSNAFNEHRQPLMPNGQFRSGFVGNGRQRYYMHVDLAQKTDRAAVALAHVEDWVKIGSGGFSSIEPVIRLDVAKWWTPQEGVNVDFRDVKEFILALRRRGFNLHRVTFDRWAGSIGLQNELARENITVETLSVGREQYNDLQFAIYDGRMEGYNLPLLVDEILGLEIDDKGRVDHSSSGSNDVADAVAGATHLCLKYEERPTDEEIEVSYVGELDETLGSLIDKPKEKRPEIEPEPTMPAEVRDFLEGARVL